MSFSNHHTYLHFINNISLIRSQGQLPESQSNSIDSILSSLVCDYAGHSETQLGVSDRGQVFSQRSHIIFRDCSLRHRGGLFWETLHSVLHSVCLKLTIPGIIGAILMVVATYTFGGPNVEPGQTVKIIGILFFVLTGLLFGFGARTWCPMLVWAPRATIESYLELVTQDQDSFELEFLVEKQLRTNASTRPTWKAISSDPFVLRLRGTFEVVPSWRKFLDHIRWFHVIHKEVVLVLDNDARNIFDGKLEELESEAWDYTEEDGRKEYRAVVMVDDNKLRTEYFGVSWCESCDNKMSAFCDLCVMKVTVYGYLEPRGNEDCATI